MRLFKDFLTQIWVLFGLLLRSGDACLKFEGTKWPLKIWVFLYLNEDLSETNFDIGLSQCVEGILWGFALKFE